MWQGWAVEKGLEALLTRGPASGTQLVLAPPALVKVSRALRVAQRGLRGQKPAWSYSSPGLTQESGDFQGTQESSPEHTLQGSLGVFNQWAQISWSPTKQTRCLANSQPPLIRASLHTQGSPLLFSDGTPPHTRVSPRGQVSPVMDTLSSDPNRELASPAPVRGFVFSVFLWNWGLNSGPTPSATPPALFFVLGIFETGSQELFAQAGFKHATS
jgi:hypothetical protein